MSAVLNNKIYRPRPNSTTSRKPKVIPFPIADYSNPYVYIGINDLSGSLPPSDLSIVAQHTTADPIFVERAIISQAINRFAKFPEVTSIYFRPTISGVEFLVFTDNGTFDGELLEKLIGIELALGDEFPGLVQDYHFVSSSLVQKPHRILDTAEMIYQR